MLSSLISSLHFTTLLIYNTIVFKSMKIPRKISK